ncbi:MAG: SUMF1/EgtB/PvdO family nonheme iron enzyme [Armatimonadetes bacterium]|nr:SUMF1/EgtB/PvdO family nonheme iron enzyme [Armatimonadota bacterium]
MQRRLVLACLTPFVLALARVPSTAQERGLKFVPIPAGEGVAAFEIGKYEVTVTQFRKFVKATGYRTTAEKQGWSIGDKGQKGDWNRIKGLNWRYGSRLSDSAKDNHPVVHVTEEDAKAFCRWAGGRLPTDGEWEHAARGGLQGRAYVWGDAWPPPKGAGNFADITAGKKYLRCGTIDGYDDGYADTAPVGSFNPNGYGLYDMAGNVWERIGDRTGGCRGGAFLGYAQSHLRDGGRSGYSSPGDYVGFRVARTTD